MMKLLVIAAVSCQVLAVEKCATSEASMFLRGDTMATVSAETGVVVAARDAGEEQLFCLTGGCYNLVSESTYTVHDTFSQLAACGAAPCPAARFCVTGTRIVADSADATDNMESPPLDEIMEGQREIRGEVKDSEQVQAARRMADMFNDVRRLQFSFDYTAGNCVNSLKECMDSSNCADDEECFFPTARRAVRQRSLVFGGNAMGQCTCKL
ncbi:hypothetical protein M885DRAFT_514467 [Pelagophyceae sp. CCMP2097]|nr:hypothetical protein M885DRAFT_514467 [Pelagophyceae sp. CCMP2097]|mmetsp:Transcript_9467/g.31294  ORF Transcript_9467/g.31294 Transcript_9467/m.31294 type:complete len:211 (-) Transcript_9467:144-776(-)